MVNIPTGGRKKKLKQSIAAMDAATRFDQSPGGRNRENAQQIGESGGGRVHRDHAQTEESDRGDYQEAGRQAHNEHNRTDAHEISTKMVALAEAARRKEEIRRP